MWQVNDDVTSVRASFADRHVLRAKRCPVSAECGRSPQVRNLHIEMQEAAIQAAPKPGLALRHRKLASSHVSFICLAANVRSHFE